MQESAGADAILNADGPTSVRNPTGMTSAPCSHFVSVGDRHLHYRTAGDGPISVFFEAGMGKSRSTWALVQPKVAEFARTIVYDRAGHGLSDTDDGGRDFDRMLSDQLTVLDAAVDRPCVVVGHSYGGPLVRLSSLHRGSVSKGAVLVDEVSEFCEPHQMAAAMRGASIMYGGQVLLAKLGLLRPFLSKLVYQRLAGEALKVALDEGTTLKSVRAARAEWQSFQGSFEALHADGPHIPQIPLTTISSNRIPPEKDRSRDFIGDAHARTADLSPDGRQIYAQGRAHYIQMTEPDLVVQEIRRMVDLVR